MSPSAERIITILTHIDDVAREILNGLAQHEDFPDFPADDFDRFQTCFDDHTEGYAATLPFLTQDQRNLVSNFLLARIHYLLFQERTF